MSRFVRGDREKVSNHRTLSTKYLNYFFTSAVFLYFTRHSGRKFLVSYTPGKRFFGEESKAQAMQGIMLRNHARESCKEIMLCNHVMQITPWNLFPLSKKSPQQSPIFRWSLRLSLDRSRCCLFNRNHRVYKRQEKNATYANFFHLAQIAGPENDRLKRPFEMPATPGGCHRRTTTRPDTTAPAPDYSIGCFNQTFVSCNATPNDDRHRTGQ